PTYNPASGEDGQPAGDIGLFVGTLKVPDGDQTRRFIARGAAGQTAEPGGQKPYAPTADDEAAATKGKARAGITADTIKNKIWDLMPIAKSTSDWRWPDGADGPGSITWQGQRLFPDSDGHVVDLQVVLHDDTLYIRDTNWLVFPSGDR